MTLTDINEGGDPPITFIGGGASEVIEGAGGDDYLAGGFGNDRIDGKGGNDTIIGGNNNDTLIGGAGDDLFLVYLHDHFDSHDGGAGYDVIRAAEDNVVIGLLGDYLNDVEEISDGGFANVAVSGDSGDQTLDFSATSLMGALEVHGGFGDDTIIGSAGDDVISGGNNNDTLIGGAATTHSLWGWPITMTVSMVGLAMIGLRP